MLRTIDLLPTHKPFEGRFSVSHKVHRHHKLHQGCCTSPGPTLALDRRPRPGPRPRPRPRPGPTASPRAGAGRRLRGGVDAARSFVRSCGPEVKPEDANEAAKEVGSRMIGGFASSGGPAASPMAASVPGLLGAVLANVCLGRNSVTQASTSKPTKAATMYTRTSNKNSCSDSLPPSPMRISCFFSSSWPSFCKDPQQPTETTQ